MKALHKQNCNIITTRPKIYFKKTTDEKSTNLITTSSDGFIHIILLLNIQRGLHINQYLQQTQKPF